jgi:CheY-like chemotaxis protein
VVEWWSDGAEWDLPKTPPLHFQLAILFHRICENASLHLRLHHDVVGSCIVDQVKPILLAEDFANDARLIQTILKRAGIINPVFVVHDGKEAIDYLSANGFYADRTKFPLPAVLLLDLKMPKVDGFEVLEWCKTQAQLREMLVVVMTGNHEVGAANRAYSLGAHSFLMKPCNVDDIRNLADTFKGYWNHPPAP